MATPLKGVRTGLLAALQGSQSLAGVQVFRRYPNELKVPRLEMLTASLDKRQISKSGFQYEVRVQLVAITDRQDPEQSLDDIEDAVDSVLDQALALTGFTIHSQYIEEVTPGEGEDEFGAALDASEIVCLFEIT